jgi:hypothetical protein
MLTLFTTCKPFVGIAAIRQMNAIESWRQLSDAEIFIFDVRDVPSLTSPMPFLEMGIRCFAFREYKYDLPYVNLMFREAQEFASYDLLVYANADLILLPDLADAVGRVAARFDRFLAVGRRWDVELDHPLDFDDPAWEDKLRNYVQGRGELHSVSGKDWMAWRRPLGLDIPPFVVGRPCWDNKVVDMALKAGVPVVDATRCVTAVHPEHGYPDGWLWDEASEHNRALCDVPGDKGRISEATWEMTAKGEIVKREFA